MNIFLESSELDKPLREGFVYRSRPLFKRYGLLVSLT